MRLGKLLSAVFSQKLKLKGFKLFRYRRKQPWPTLVVQNEGWDIAYAEQKGDLSVLPTVGEAVTWVNELIAKIDNA